ncbi:Protein SABRE [Sorochytrium milnesiophthora]
MYTLLLTRLALSVIVSYAAARLAFALAVRLIRARYNVSADNFGLFSLSGIEWTRAVALPKWLSQYRAEGAGDTATSAGTPAARRPRRRMAQVQIRIGKIQFESARSNATTTAATTAAQNSSKRQRMVRLNIIKPSVLVSFALDDDDADSASPHDEHNGADTPQTADASRPTTEQTSSKSLFRVFVEKQAQTLLYHFVMYVLVRWVDVHVSQAELAVRCTANDSTTYSVVYRQQLIIVDANLLWKMRHGGQQQQQEPAAGTRILDHPLESDLRKSDRIELSVRLSAFDVVLSILDKTGGQVYQQNILSSSANTHRLRIVYLLSLPLLKLSHPHIYVDIGQLLLRLEVLPHLYKAAAPFVAMHRQHQQAQPVKQARDAGVRKPVSLPAMSRLIHFCLADLSVLWSFSRSAGEGDCVGLSLKSFEALLATSMPAAVLFPPPAGADINVECRVGHFDLGATLDKQQHSYFHLNTLDFSTRLVNTETSTGSMAALYNLAASAAAAVSPPTTSQSSGQTDDRPTVKSELVVQTLHIRADPTILLCADAVFAEWQRFVPPPPSPPHSNGMPASSWSPLSSPPLSRRGSGLLAPIPDNISLLERQPTLAMVLSRYALHVNAQVHDVRITLALTTPAGVERTVQVSLDGAFIKMAQTLRQHSTSATYAIPTRHVQSHASLSDLSLKVKHGDTVIDVLHMELTRGDLEMALPLFSVQSLNGHLTPDVTAIGHSHVHLTSDVKCDVGISHVRMQVVLLDEVTSLARGMVDMLVDVNRRVEVFKQLASTLQSEQTAQPRCLTPTRTTDPYSQRWQLYLTLNQLDVMVAARPADQHTHLLGIAMTLSKLSARVSRMSQAVQQKLPLSGSHFAHTAPDPVQQLLMLVNDKMTIDEWTLLCENVALDVVEQELGSATHSTPHHTVARFVVLPRLCCESKSTVESIIKPTDTRPLRISTRKAIVSLDGDVLVKYSLLHHLALMSVLTQAAKLAHEDGRPMPATSPRSSQQSQAAFRRARQIQAAFSQALLQEHSEVAVECCPVLLEIALPDDVVVHFALDEISASMLKTVDSHDGLATKDASVILRQVNMSANRSTTTLAAQDIAAKSLFVDPPAEPDFYDDDDHQRGMYRLLSIPQVQVHLLEDTRATKVHVDLEPEFAFTVPYGYMPRDILENASIAVKTCKTMLFDALGLQSHHASGVPPVWPSVHITAPLVTLAFQDSPFEVRLGEVFKSGMAEQQRRLTQQAALLEKIRELELAVHSANSVSAPPNTAPDDGLLAQGIQALWSELNHYHAQEWVRIVKATPRLSTIAPANIFFATFSGISIQLSAPTLSSANIPTTLADLDAATPPNLTYELLIAQDVLIALREYTIRVRDYPLPVMHFPPPQTPSPPVIPLRADAANKTSDTPNGRPPNEHILVKGLLVIAEPLPAPSSMMTLPVDLSWRRYVCTIAKNMSPLKLYGNLVVCISGPSISTVCWGPAYEPVLSDVGRIFDTFTKTSLDPSEPLPWWDKFRWLAHGGIRWQFVDDATFKFRFVGSRSPYSTLLYNAGSPGIEIVTRGTTHMWLGDTTKKRNYPIGLATEDFAVVIPLETIGEDVDKSQMDCLLSDDGECFMRFTENVVMGFSPHFHSDESVPRRSHCDIHMQGPDVVWDQPHCDSFAGFRSLSLTMRVHVKSEGGGGISLPRPTTATSSAPPPPTIRNEMQLSPGAIQYIMQCVQFNVDAKSTPARNGILFPITSPLHTHKKLGLLLTSFYLDVTMAPVMVYFLHRQNAILSPDDAVGLQFVIQKCHIDFHCERFRPQDTHLNPPPWFIDTTEIDFDDVEGRTAQLVQAYADASTSTSSSVPPDFLGQQERIYVKWLDTVSTFYVISEPFFWTPRLSYCRKSDVSYGRPSKFGQDTNNVQLLFLQQRLNEIDAEIAVVKDMLKSSTRSFTAEQTFEAEQQLAQLWKQHNIVSRYTVDLQRNGRHSTAFLREHLQQQLGSTVGRADHTCFMHQFCVHNARLLWRSSVRNVVYRLIDQQQQFQAVHHYTSNAALKVLRRLAGAANEIEANQRYSYASNSSSANISHSTSSRLDRPDSLSSYAESVSSRTASDDEAGQMSAQQLLQRLIDDSHNLIVTDDADKLPPRDDDDLIPEMRELHAAQLADKVSYNIVVMFINPQIKLECTPDPETPTGCCIVTAESTCLTQFGIMKGNELASTMTIVKIDDAQFSVAADPATAALLGLRASYLVSDYAPWLPVEYVISTEVQLRGHCRVVERVQTSLYHKQRNVLSVHDGQDKTSIAPTSSQLDSWHLDFSPCSIGADSLAYSVLYDIFGKLLLYSEPSRQMRQEQLDTIVLGTQAEDVQVVVESILKLRQEISELSLAMSYDKHILTRDDQVKDPVAKWTSLGKRLGEARDDLAVVMEALKTIMDGKTSVQDRSRPTYQTNITASRVEWDMLDDQRQVFCQVGLENIVFSRVDHSDDMHIFTIGIDTVTGANRLPHAVYPDMLVPFIIDDRLLDFSRSKMLRVYWRAMSPVGGIPVVDHFEINIFPLQVQLTYEVGRQIMHYIFPQKNLTSGPVNVASAGSQQPHSHHGLGHLHLGHSSHNLSANASATDGSDALAPLEVTVLERSVPSIGSNSAAMASSSTLHLSQAGLASTNSAPLPSLPVRRNSLKGGYAESIAPSPLSEHLPTRKEVIQASGALRQMKRRAESNKTFIYIKVPGAQHCFSYKGSKEKNLEDFHQFALTTPTLEYRNKTWSWFEFMSHVRRDLVKAILLQAGSLVKEKLFARRSGMTPSASSTTLNSQLASLGVSVRGSPEEAHDSQHSLPQPLRTRGLSNVRPLSIPEERQQGMHKSTSTLSVVTQDDLEKARLLLGRSYTPLHTRLASVDHPHN